MNNQCNYWKQTSCINHTWHSPGKRCLPTPHPYHHIPPWILPSPKTSTHHRLLSLHHHYHITYKPNFFVQRRPFCTVNMPSTNKCWCTPHITWNCVNAKMLSPKTMNMPTVRSTEIRCCAKSWMPWVCSWAYLLLPLVQNTSSCL